MKTALVSIIRNGASDLLDWIGWHALLGVDTFVLFYYSNDRDTHRLLKAAAIQHDIRIFRLKKNYETPWKSEKQVFWEHERTVYVDTLLALKEDADWVTFLETDEYLALHRHNTLKSFLKTFDNDVEAVGINWCLYGSNGYVTSPNMPPFYAYTRHSAPDKPVNQHIKTFIRPQCWNGEWHNSLAFFPKQGRYVDPQGDDISWRESPGIIDKTPNWDTAYVMKFRNKSLEHFVQLTKKLDNTFTFKDFFENEYNDRKNTRHQGRLPSVIQWVRNVVFQGVGEVLDNLPRSYDTPAPKSNSSNMLSVYHLTPWNDEKLEIHRSYACSQLIPKNSTSLFFLHNKKLPQTGFIFALDAESNILDFHIIADSRLTSVLRYALLPTDEDDRVFLQKTNGSNECSTFLASVSGETLIADRLTAHLWEKFSLVPANKTPDNREWNDLAFIRIVENALQNNVSLSTIERMAHEDRITTIRFLPLLYASLTEKEQRLLSFHLGVFVPFVL